MSKAVCAQVLHAAPDIAYNFRMHEVILYSREGCHLCDVVKETLAKLDGSANFRWQMIDIDTDPVLRERYNEEVPVVFIDGRKAFKYRMEPQQFLRVLAGRAAPG